MGNANHFESRGVPASILHRCGLFDLIVGAKKDVTRDWPDLVGRSDVRVGPRGQRRLGTRTQKRTLVLAYIPKERFCFGKYASLKLHQARNSVGGFSLGAAPRGTRNLASLPIFYLIVELQHKGGEA